MIEWTADEFSWRTDRMIGWIRNNGPWMWMIGRVTGVPGDYPFAKKNILAEGHALTFEECKAAAEKAAIDHWDDPRQ